MMMRATDRAVFCGSFFALLLATCPPSRALATSDDALPLPEINRTVRSALSGVEPATDAVARLRWPVLQLECPESNGPSLAAMVGLRTSS